MKRRKDKAERLREKQREQKPRGLNWPSVISIHDNMPKLKVRFPIILAPGPASSPHLQGISLRNTIIGVNSAVLIPKMVQSLPGCEFDIDIWFVQDPRVCGKKWFKTADQRFKGIRVFSVQAAVLTPSYKKAKQLKTGHYIFEYCNPEQSMLPWEEPRQRFRTDTTVTGSAIWFAYRAGAYGVRLIGADFYGADYLNGSSHPQKPGMKTWPQQVKADAMIKWLMQQKFIVSSLSPTALKSVVPDCRIRNCPKKVYLVAPGPQGRMYYNAIPAIDPDTGVAPFIAVMNRSALIDKEFEVHFKPDAWFAADKDAVNKDWWEPAYQHFKGLKYFSNEVIARIPKCEYDGRFPIDADNGWIFRSAGTVVGTALVTLYMSGVEEVVLIGVDMSGNQYAGGTANDDPRWKQEHGKIWNAVPVLDNTIKWLRTRGMRIRSMSPTRLREVEMI